MIRLLIAVILSIPCLMELRAVAIDRPNMVFILADDLGAHDPACFGSTYHETPNIDRLAARGVKMTQAYAASPLCSPTRSSILTGQYPARIGITSPACHLPAVQLKKELSPGGPTNKVLNANSLTRLRPDYFTLAEALKEGGYATAHFGKWHLGHNLRPDEHYEPKDQGFDSDFPHTPSAPGPGGGYLAPWTKFIKDPAIVGKPGEHIEDRMSQEAARYIHEHKDRPFYVNYWAYSVHSPWNARQDYIDYFKPKADPQNPQHNPLYAAMVRSLDDGVGRIVDAIDQAGIADRTIIVFFSDNGGWAYPPKATDPDGYADEPATSNLPQRSGKASLYDGGTREPCIIVWPGKIKAGSVNDALFQSTDFYPTLLSMAAMKPHADVKLDGFDQSQMLQGGKSPRERIFCHFPHGTGNQAKEIPGFLPGTYVRDGDWKLLRFFADNDDGTDRFELYDLRADPGESHDLAATQPERVRQLNALIDGFLKDTDAVVPKRNPAYNTKALAKADDEFPGLQGWKPRGCKYAVKDGIATITPTNATPFLGVTAGTKGAFALTIHARSAAGGTGKIEWLAPGAAAKDAKSVPLTLSAGAFQDVTVHVPAQGAAGILRIYLPAQHTIEIDRIELKAGGKPRRWDF